MEKNEKNIRKNMKKIIKKLDPMINYGVFKLAQTPLL